MGSTLVLSGLSAPVGCPEGLEVALTHHATHEALNYFVKVDGFCTKMTIFGILTNPEAFSGNIM